MRSACSDNFMTDVSSQEVLQYHDQTTRNYRETIENLQKVNKTVAYILRAIDNMQKGLESKLDWLTNFVGGTGLDTFYHRSLCVWKVIFT